MDTIFSSQGKVRNSYQAVISDIKISIDSEVLFKDNDIVFILHKGEQYSLRRTRNGKLILNK